MKEIFFYVTGGMFAFAIVGWALYMIWDALVEVWNDWWLGRELNQLERESATRRQERSQRNEARLATGCEHDFHSGSVGLPPRVCSKCGLEQEKSTGGCDHAWRVKPGPVPSSACEKCGKTYSPLDVPSGSSSKR